MPIYDYRCDHCGHAFSAVQSFKDDALAACPSCGKRPRRLITTPAIVFKGSGWYKTDSRAPSTPEVASSAKDGASGTSASGTSASGTSDGGEKKAPAKSAGSPSGEATS